MYILPVPVIHSFNLGEKMTQEELDFIGAIADFQKENDKLFLSWCEVLKIVKNLGYRQPADPKNKEGKV